MVIIISYNKQTWNEYNNSQNVHKNLANGAIISADKLNHMETGISNNDTNKVTDNKNGSIQVNGSSITPADDSKVVHTTDTSNWQKQAMFNPGDFKIDTTSPTTDFATLLKSKYNKSGVVYIRENNGSSYITQFIDAVVICEGGGYWYAYGIGTNGNFAHRQITPSHDTGWVINADDSTVVHSKDMRKPASDVAGIEEVNTKQDKISYTPADDSKVAHNSGNEEIAGQKTFDTAPIDKTTGNPYITKSDLSNGLSTKVTDNKDGLSTKVTDNKDNTITANNVKYDLSKTGLTPISFVNSGSFNDLPLGTVMANAPTMTDGPITDTNHGYTTTTFYSSEWGGRKAQIAIADNANLMYFRVGENIDKSASWNSWVLLSDDSKVVHSKDMRKPASDVAGIDEVNTKQDKIGYTPADDSKVVHTTLTQLNSTDMNTVLTAGFYHLISGTNGMPNADEWTIYQVILLSGANGVQLAYGTNNTILGMRSWNMGPGHITFTSWVQFADDSKVAHLSGANNFDTVPTVNNNPLLLASSLPSDLARTTKDANFTAKLQKSGIDVATTTDVNKAVNTATSNFSKHIEASKNDEDSAISDSTRDNSGNIYYWTEG